MSKPLYQDLVNQQIAVLRATSFIAIGFIFLILVVIYTVFGITQVMPEIMLAFIVGTLINILLLPVHKKPFITYIVLIGLSFAELIGIILVTGGLSSPMILVLVTIPGFAFYTSRKQGKIWFVICILAILIIYNAERFNIPITNIVSDKFLPRFVFLIILFATVLNSVYLLLVKTDVSKAHKSFSNASKDLEEKSKRMENLIMLVNNSTELMCVIDLPTMTFDELNPLFKILLGYELSELKGQPAKNIMKDESILLLSALRENGVIMFDSKMLCKSGEEKSISWSATARNGKLYTYGRDITPTKKK
jgi:hypothetical protein